MHHPKCLQQPLRTLWSKLETQGGWSPFQAWARPTATSLSAWSPERGRGISGRRTSTPRPPSLWKTSWLGRKRSQQVQETDAEENHLLWEMYVWVNLAFWTKFQFSRLKNNNIGLSVSTCCSRLHLRQKKNLYIESKTSCFLMLFVIK